MHVKYRIGVFFNGLKNIWGFKQPFFSSKFQMQRCAEFEHDAKIQAD